MLPAPAARISQSAISKTAIPSTNILYKNNYIYLTFQISAHIKKSIRACAPHMWIAVCRNKNIILKYLSHKQTARTIQHWGFSLCLRQYVRDGWASRRSRLGPFCLDYTGFIKRNRRIPVSRFIFYRTATCFFIKIIQAACWGNLHCLRVRSCQ